MNRAGFNFALPFMGERAKQTAAFGQPLSRKRALGIIRAGVFSLLACTAHAVADEAQLSRQIAACSSQTDSSERLACYDGLALSVKTGAGEKPTGTAGSDPINEENALFKLSCAYFAKDC